MARKPPGMASSPSCLGTRRQGVGHPPPQEGQNLNSVLFSEHPFARRFDFRKYDIGIITATICSCVATVVSRGHGFGRRQQLSEAGCGGRAAGHPQHPAQVWAAGRHIPPGAAGPPPARIPPGQRSQPEAAPPAKPGSCEGAGPRAGIWALGRRFRPRSALDAGPRHSLRFCVPASWPGRR